MIPRIAPGGLSQLGVTNWLVCKLLSRVAGAQDVHLFSTLARQRGLFRAWLHFSSRMMPGGSISRHETELVILRVAHLRQCQYETDHHIRIGRRVGVDRALLERIWQGPSAPGWNDRQRTLLRAVDALVETKNIDDHAWQALRAHYDEQQLIELCLLVGQYEMLATTIAALRIAPDFKGV